MSTFWESSLPKAEVTVNEVKFQFHIPNKKSLYVIKNISNREPEVYTWIDRYLSKECLLLDVGANYGQFSLYSAKKFNNQIIAFEPHFASYFIMQRNIIANKLSDNITLLPVAISNTPVGHGTFRLKDISAGRAYSTLIQENLSKEIGTNLQEKIQNTSIQQDIDNLYYRNSIVGLESEELIQSVPVNTVDNILKDQSLYNNSCKEIHLKIDVDGTELLVILGAMQSLKKIKSIMTEFLPSKIRSHLLLETILKFHGFKVEAEYEGNKLFTN